MGTSDKQHYSINKINNERINYEKTLKKDLFIKDRKKSGQFFTPLHLSDEITINTLKYLSDFSKISFLEPFVGTGSFIIPLLKYLNQDLIIDALGIDIDSEFIDFCKKTYSNVNNTDFYCRNFVDYNIDKKFDLIITNPPYVRSQNISKKTKIKLKNKINDELGINISGHSDLYIYMIFLSYIKLKQNGLATFLIPSLFMETEYGKVLKKFLINNVKLLQVHTYDDIKYFDFANVKLSVITFKKEKPKKYDHVLFSYGKSIIHPNYARRINIFNINYNDKWSNKQLLKEDSAFNKNITLGEFFTAHRGIATGANNFFIVDNYLIDKLKLEREMLHPILPNPKNLNNNYITSDYNGYPNIGNKEFLINTRLYPNKIKESFPNIYKYLNKGKGEISKRYIPRNRKVWYWQEIRKPAPILMAYFARKTNKNKTGYRFIRNKSIAIASNAYILLYPKYNMSSEALDETVNRLNQLDEDDFIINERKYGGGLKKLEPKEILNIYLK